MPAEFIEEPRNDNDVGGLKRKVQELLRENRKLKDQIRLDRQERGASEGSVSDAPTTARDEFFAANAHRLRGLKSAERAAMIETIVDEWVATPEGSATLQAAREGVGAAAAKLTEQHDRILLEQTARSLVSKLARKGSEEVLMPQVLSRLTVDDSDGEARVTVLAPDGSRSAATLDQLADELRANPAFMPVIEGASPQEKVQHAHRVAEMLKTSANSGMNKSMTRAAFDALSPAARSAHVTAGGIVTDSV